MIAQSKCLLKLHLIHFTASLLLAATYLQFAAAETPFSHALRARLNDGSSARRRGGGGTVRAFAAPVGPNAVGDPPSKFNVMGGSQRTFIKVGGYHDGITNGIFEETEMNAPPDTAAEAGKGQEIFAYEDNQVLDPGREAPLTIPAPYRSDGTLKENWKEGQAAKPKTPIMPSTATIQPESQTNRLLVASGLDQLPPISIRTTTPSAPTQSEGSQPTKPLNRGRIRPGLLGRVGSVDQRTLQQQPERLSSQPPAVPRPSLPQQTSSQFPQPQPELPSPPPPQPEPQPSSQLQLPPPQLQPLRLQPPQPPPVQPATAQPPPPQQSTALPPQPPPVFQTAPPEPPAQASFTQPPSLPRVPQRPLRPLRPFRPRVNPPNQPPRNNATSPLRSGVCPNTIFYQSAPATPAELQQAFSHFALVVSIDQCARTCHEFNCANAFFDPRTKHCQFNPATKFTQPAGVCPQWPNPLYRNNIAITEQALRISCVTCQRRRRPASRFSKTSAIKRQSRFSSFLHEGTHGSPVRMFHTTGFSPMVIGHTFVNAAHGVLLKQPRAIAIEPSLNLLPLSSADTENERHASVEESSGQHRYSKLARASSSEMNYNEEKASSSLPPSTPGTSAPLSSALKIRITPVRLRKEQANGDAEGELRNAGDAYRPLASAEESG